MSIEEAVIGRIQALLEHRHWTIYRLSKETGIPTSTLGNFFNRGTCPTIPTLHVILKGFGLSLEEFFEGIGKEGAEDALPKSKNTELTKEEEEILYSYRALSKSDRGLFSAYLKGLSKKL